MNTEAKTQNELVLELYNRVENGILYAQYNGHTTPEIKKYTFDNLQRFFTSLDKKELTEISKILTNNPKSKINAILKKAVELLTSTDLFTKTIKPTMQGLTISEATVMEFLCNELATWRFDEPGYSCVGGTDITKYLKKLNKDWNAKSTSGVVSSLVKKGYLQTHDDFKDIVYPQWCRVPKSFPSVMTVETATKPKDKVVVTASKSSKASEKASLLAAAVKKAIVTPQAKLDKKVLADVFPAPVDKTKGKKIAQKTKTVIAEVVAGKKYKPFEKFGSHGSNCDLAGFVAGCKINFEIKGLVVTGEYVHFHINNHSPKGYVVIRYEGKIYERVINKVSLSGLPVGERSDDLKVAAKGAEEDAVIEANNKNSEISKKTKAAINRAKAGSVLMDMAIAAAEAAMPAGKLTGKGKSAKKSTRTYPKIVDKVLGL